MAEGTPLYTIPQARAELQAWSDALAAVRRGQSYSIAGRSLTRQDVPTIRAEIQRWHNTVRALEVAATGRARAMGAQASFPPPGSGGGGVLISAAQWTDPDT